ncbi:Proline-rich protein 23A3 [Microtus ochrogaster]|uniref:Proline-rich protein 23A3 n=1 Tax=Microtus ochrogaster TaxID=79684 RepID=A0A8J6GZ25_MICOH|nr:Proline-rich protein 23A3 [Microtus ochrogaster]
MRGVRPLSPGADAETGLTPQPQEPSPDQRRDLEEPPATPGLEEPAGSASDVPTSVVYLAADSAVQLQVDDVDLLLEPDATSVLEVELPEQTIILVPEGLQAPDHHGQPGSLSASPQGGAGPEMPEDDLLVLQPGSSCQFILENSYQEEFFDEDEDSGPPVTLDGSSSWSGK